MLIAFVTQRQLSSLLHPLLVQGQGLLVPPAPMPPHWVPSSQTCCKEVRFAVRRVPAAGITQYKGAPTLWLTPRDPRTVLEAAPSPSLPGYAEKLLSQPAAELPFHRPHLCLSG